MRRSAVTLILTRVQCYENCTLGRLSDPQGRMLCMTLEPRWRDKRVVVNDTCVRAGRYRVVFGYDTEMRYQCWHLTAHHLRSIVRFCFYSKSGSVPAHTHGDILLGYLGHDEGEDVAFDGMLHRPVEAYECLRDYYNSLRANHSDFVLRIDDPIPPVTWLPALESPPLRPDQIQLEDYIVETL